MIVSENPHIRMIHGDCMEFMKELPDNAYDLAIVDPPYGINASDKAALGTSSNRPLTRKQKSIKTGDWDRSVPPREYFDEIFRISENQIICGGNYFDLPPTRGIICWDKGACMKGRSFSEFELIWSSFDKPARIFEYNHTASLGFVSRGESERENKIHPTQKPVALYKWLLQNYAKPGDKILDTHGGSGSIAIACYDMGFDLDWIELDEDYYKAAVKRFNQHMAQPTIFHPVQPEMKQGSLL